jgi:hypothetical protein
MGRSVLRLQYQIEPVFYRAMYVSYGPSCRWMRHLFVSFVFLQTSIEQSFFYNNRGQLDPCYLPAGATFKKPIY